jgi:hypothetical protein
MELISINRCINKEVKYYGLGGFGLVVGCITIILVWINFSIIFAMISGGFGYFVGDIIGRYWHQGQIQKYTCWHFSAAFLISKKLHNFSHRDFV